MTRTEATPAVAHNKAAQAVAAWRAGLRFTTVSINPENGRDWPARLHHDKAPKWFQPQLDSGDRTRLLAERRILVSFAGQIAKEKFLSALSVLCVNPSSSAVARPLRLRARARLRKLSVRPDARLCVHAPEEAIVARRHRGIRLCRDELPFPPQRGA